jgi:imidazolonepropionase-like amidohydrolase
MKTLLAILGAFAAALGALGATGAIGAMLAAQERAALTYAITNARIVPVSGAPIDNGTIVFRNGLIAQVGAGVSPPAAAVVIEGKGLTVYPGLIDMGSTAGVDMPAAPRADNPRTTEEIERAKRALLIRPQLDAAEHVDPTAQALARSAAAGITTILATPSGDAIRGQSALVNTSPGPDAPQIGGLADDRRGQLVVKAPVALHVSFAERPSGGNAYPVSLMGVIAFVRQAFLDAQYQQAALQHYEKSKARGPRPPYDPALDAMQPALEGSMPVAFEAEAARQILRALDMAKTFKLNPIITNGREADRVTADLKAANARVILSLNYPTRPQALAPDADEPLQTLRDRANAPKTAAALDKAGVSFAFASAGLSDPKDFVKNAAKAVQNGLSRERAVRALTLGAATIAGAEDRLGSLESGKIANLVVTEGDLFDEKMTVKHVFVDGKPVTLDLPAPAKPTQPRP